VPHVPSTLHDLPFAALERTLVEAGVNRSHTAQLWQAVHRENVADLSCCPGFVPPLRRWLERTAPALERVTVDAEIISSDDRTRKYLLKLEDGQTIETVVMGYPGRFTACVSTQAGCAMGCVFCATGQMGFARHLRTGEIVAQVLHAQRTLRARGEPGLRNLVLMGMGEPLHNYDAVMAALDILTDSRGVGLGPNRIAISTVGVIPGILRLAEEPKPYRLAVSLHAANQAERQVLVPSAARWPLDELIEACRVYCARTQRRIFFEWTLIDGKNDSADHAAEVSALLRGIDGHVNLIPLNPTSGFNGGTSERAKEFQRVLREAGLPSTVRQRRGIDVAAGCGQLRAAR